MKFLRCLEASPRNPLPRNQPTTTRPGISRSLGAVFPVQALLLRQPGQNLPILRTHVIIDPNRIRERSDKRTRCGNQTLDELHPLVFLPGLHR